MIAAIGCQVIEPRTAGSFTSQPPMLLAPPAGPLSGEIAPTGMGRCSAPPIPRRFPVRRSAVNGEGTPQGADTTGRCCMWMQRHGYQMPGCPRKRAITSASRAGIDVMVNGSVMQTKVTEAREGSSPSTINQSTEARFIKPRASSVSARRHAPLVFGVRAGQSNLASGAAGGSPAPITGESTP